MKAAAGKVFQDNDSGKHKGDKGFAAFVKIDEIIPNPCQPRKTYKDDKLRDLEASIKAHGIIQPLVVVKKGEKYQLVVGERRWKAAKEAGVREVPVIFRDVDEKQGLEVAMVENLHREDLNPMEEARAYLFLIEEHCYSQEMLSQRIGKSRPSIANTLRLLNLPIDIQNDIAGGVLSQGHGRALLSIENEAAQRIVWEKIKRRHLSVRQTEELVRNMKTIDEQPGEKVPLEVSDVEQRLRFALGTRVKVRENKKGKGRIEIHFLSRQDFERLAESLILNIPRVRKSVDSLESSLL